MNRYKNIPCKTCRLRVCQEMDCQRWQQWFLEGWGEVQRYAWEQMDAQGMRERQRFCYELPHLQRSPCDGCVCQHWCEVPCARRLNWWNERVYAKR